MKSKAQGTKSTASKENARNGAGADSLANRKRKTSTGSQNSIQSQSTATAAGSKRPALGSVSELEMVR